MLHYFYMIDINIILQMTERDFQDLIDEILAHSTNGMEIQARIYLYNV